MADAPVWLADLVLACIAAEALFLGAWARRHPAARRDLRFLVNLAHLLAGAALTLAFRFALEGASLALVGGGLAVAGVVHAWHLRLSLAPPPEKRRT